MPRLCLFAKRPYKEYTIIPPHETLLCLVNYRFCNPYQSCEHNSKSLKILSSNYCCWSRSIRNTGSIVLSRVGGERSCCPCMVTCIAWPSNNIAIYLRWQFLYCVVISKLDFWKIRTFYFHKFICNFSLEADVVWLFGHNGALLVGGQVQIQFRWKHFQIPRKKIVKQAVSKVHV